MKTKQQQNSQIQVRTKKSKKIKKIMLVAAA